MRKTPNSAGMIPAYICCSLLDQVSRPGLNVLRFQIRGDVSAVIPRIHAPESAQVRLALRRTRYGCGEIGFSVRRAREDHDAPRQPAPLALRMLDAALQFDNLAILQAGKKPIRQVKTADLGIADAQLARRMAMTGNKAPKQERKGVVFNGADAAEQLVAALKKEGVAQ